MGSNSDTSFNSGFFSNITKQFSGTSWVSYNSDPTYLEVASDPTG